MPFLVNGDAWTADYGFTLNAADRFLPHLSSVPYGSDHVDHVPLFLTMSCLRCFHPRLFWQILVTVIKSFTLTFSFFSTNILAAEVTTVRLSVDCVGSGRIVLFAPIGRASHHLSRSHFSTWLGLSRCVLNRTLAVSTAPVVVMPHYLSVSTRE